MTNQSDYSKWVELADKRPWDIGDRHDFCELSLKLASKVEKLVSAVERNQQAIYNMDCYVLNDWVSISLDDYRTFLENQSVMVDKALKELMGK